MSKFETILDLWRIHVPAAPLPSFSVRTAMRYPLDLIERAAERTGEKLDTARKYGEAMDDEGAARYFLGTLRHIQERADAESAVSA